MRMKSYKKSKIIYYACVSLYAVMIIFLIISLVSYRATDSSCMYISSEPEVIANYGGYYGAHIAALLFYLFGGASFLLFVPLIAGLIIITNRSMRLEWERLGASLYLVCVSAALLATYGIDFSWSPYPGGIIGLVFTQKLIHYGDYLGQMLFLYMSLCVIFVLLLRWSFMILVRYVMYAVTIMYFLMKEYRVISNIIHAFAMFIRFFFIRLPLFFALFVRSFFDRTLFDNTGLMYPESDDDYEESLKAIGYSNQLRFCTASLKRKTNEQKVNAAITSITLRFHVMGKVKTDTYNEYRVSVRDQEIEQSALLQKMNVINSYYTLPHMNIFVAEKNANEDHGIEQELHDRAHILQDKLKRFGINGKVVAIKRGPVVTLFEYQPDVDTKLSKIVVLEDDLTMALQAMSIRIIAPIPGRSVVGFEVANKVRYDVLFSHIINQVTYTQFSGSLPLVLGKGTIGEAVVVDLARMPHLLIAGSTGSGKSVALNGILISLLCALGPDELKLILIDPKRLEFASFADIAHLLFPIVTNPVHAVPVLKWVVEEMENRYEKMAQCGARNITDYNNRITQRLKEGLLIGNENKELLPFIVVVIDELADLMMTAGRDIEDFITRITQMARAAGIHMIVATQRPSVDVVTGLIKANFPSRISFRVASRIDSRTILDAMGAERLLGRGDMLFLDATTSQLRRVHGAYVSDQQIEQVTNHIRMQRKVTYLDMHRMTTFQEQELSPADDLLYKDIRLFLDEIDEISISLLQRKFRIGYNKSARIIDMLESQGLIMPQDGRKTRKVIR